MMFSTKLKIEDQRKELQKLLAPISAEAPVGANVRSDPNTRDEIRGIESLFKDAFNAERRQEQYRLFPGDAPPPEPNWAGFIEQALEHLETKSKDLLLATLVAEASVREFGPRGLLLSIELISGLVESYWPNIFPTQDPDATKNARFSAWKHAYDWPERLAPRLETLMKLTASGVTFADFAEAAKLDDPQLPPGIREERVRKGAKTTETIRGEIRQKESQFKTLYSDLLDCRSALLKLVEISQTKCISPDPEISIPLPEFDRTIDGITRMIASSKTVAWPGLLPDDDSNKSAESGGNADGESAGQNAGVVLTGVPAGQMTREAAFTQLRQLANFFRLTEPHSPISYAIEQTVRWGKMSLPELLTELIANADARQNLFERTGLPKTKSEPE